MGTKDKLEYQNRQRTRLLYALEDFELALSASAFLAECDPYKIYSKVDLRRFKCYETTAIISYARPFSQSVGSIPRLKFALIRDKLDEELQNLHHSIIEMRNKKFAHSDAEMMRMFCQTSTIDIGKNFNFILLQTTFDRGLTFIGTKLVELNKLLHVAHYTIYKTLFDDAQKNPEKFNLVLDQVRP